MRPPGPVPGIAPGSRSFSLISLRTTGDSSRPLAPGSPSAGGAAAGADAAAGAGCAAAGAGAGGSAAAAAGAPAAAPAAGAPAAGAPAAAPPAAGASAAGVPAAGAAEGAGDSAGASSAPGTCAAASSAGASASAGACSAAGASPPPAGASPMRASTTPTSTVSPSCTRISDSTPLTGDGTSESTLSVDTSKSGSSSATCSPICLNHLVIVPSVTVSPSWGIWMSAIGPGPFGDDFSGSVEAATGHVEDRVAEQLGEGGMRLDERGDLVDRRLPVDGQVALAELLGHPRSDHVHPDDLAGAPVGALDGDDLHQALLVTDDLGPAVGAVAVLRGHDVEPGLLGRLLRVAGERHLGLAVDAPWHPAVVDRHGLLTEDVGDGDDGLGEADMRELGRVDAVAHRPHALLARAAHVVDHHEAPLVELHARSLEAQVGGGGLASHGDDHHVGLDRVGALDVDDGAAVRRLVAGDVHAGAHVDVALLERALDDLGDVPVEAGQDLGQRLEHGDLRTQVGHHRREL